MDKEIFLIRLNEARNSAVRFAKEFVINELSDNLIFRIKPNSFDFGNHIDELKKNNLIERKKELRKAFTINEITNQLVIGDKVPVWIGAL